MPIHPGSAARSCRVRHPPGPPIARTVSWNNPSSPTGPRPAGAQSPANLSRGTLADIELPPFHNEPVLDLAQDDHREELLEGLTWLDARLPLSVPIWIGTERRDGRDLVSADPADPARAVATAPIATALEVTAAVSAAERG
ncbi:MAG TPA: hypothetical protein VNT55_24610, partial [Baekduia sp.]|nr:hypothetical protein [Baekduia sp.]